MRQWICGVFVVLFMLCIVAPVEVYANRMIEAQQVMEGEPELGFSVENKRVKLSWTSVKGATHYQVFRKTEHGKYKLIKTTKKLTFADKNVEDGNLYYYKVRAIYKANKKIRARTDYSNMVKHYYDYVDVSKKMVALTFDDGPSAYTEEILDCLEANHGRATFFVVGKCVPRRAKVVQHAVEIGCEIGNHTYNHVSLTSLSYDDVKQEISKTKEAVEAATDGKFSPVLVRPPFGNANSTVKSAVDAPLIYWTIDTRDWAHENVQTTIDTVLSRVQDGSIVLMHDNHSATKVAALYLIPELQRRGYQLLTVSEMAHYKEVKLEKGVAYYNFY